VEAAVRAQQAGVDVIIAQGVEAGGHVAGEVSPCVSFQQRCTKAVGHRCYLNLA